MVVVPTILERNNDKEYMYDLYSCLLKKRIILLNGEINDTMSSSICAQLLYLSSLSKDPIQIYINSNGGSISAGLAIYDIMQYIPCEISTICMGLCASMAAVLLAAGTKGKRCALEHAEVMIHQPIGGMQGQAKDMEIAMEHMTRTKNTIYEILSKTTLQPKDQILKDCDRDYFMNAYQAKNYGIIDHIIKKSE